ncbi:hypothetical protein KKF84_01280, partial [Myxococcota bacterium]|nr:hypothetical protein [Myxococcota bacterium]
MKRFIPLGVLLFLFGCGSRAPRESRRIDLVTDRHQAGRLLASLSPETLTRDERIAEARNLAGFLQKHPGWLPLATVEKLMALHEAAPGIVEGAFVNYLKVWPVPGYYPLRDDPAAVRVIRLLAKWNQGPLLLQAATALNRRITVEDPRAKVRLTLADVSHLLPAGTERQELLKEFLLSKTARYTLFKATASAMGRIGTRDPSMVPIFIRGLYTVRQGISASLESAFALGTCYADAAALSRRLLVSVA